MSELALFGGTPVRRKGFPQWPVYDERERRNLIEVLESRNWGGFPFPSKRAQAFGERFARFCGAKYGIPVANGSVSLEIALRAIGIKAGDEVIVPCYTWIATAAAPVHLNAVPVFVDVEETSYCISPHEIEKAINHKTKAIIVVHLGSSVADMDRIMEIAERYGLVVIEDCAHAHGARWRDKGVGSIGHFGSFSFQSSKLMTCGEGGAVITSNNEWFQRCLSIINCGRKESGYDQFDGYILGSNYRITDFQVAILDAQLDRLEESTLIREKNLQYFRKRLEEEVEGLRVLDRDQRVTRQACYQVVMKYDPKKFSGIHRDVFLKALEAEGIEMDGTFYLPIYQSPLFNAISDEWPMLRERYGDGVLSAQISCPVAERAAYHEAVWMHYPYLMGTQEDIEDIIKAIKKVQQHANELL